ncbi:Gfo/Idh/MocA family protein [Acutalibacter caecimuris]|uniref:Gfo/Idh/MocA family protein n=1 Tax=Acutalibacter caecimuris TaxID=3093657 RepID=UPI002AC8AAAE|nr:Gfo/Idh/MocA family oxidoreductase [Acutalibacter sp. M00118]
MEKKLWRIGSVGIGGISQGGHLPGIANSPDLQLTAVCDIKPERMEYAREKYGVDAAHCFADYHDLINCSEVDAVDISTSNNAHFQVAKAAIEAGKPYCIEKPVTMTAEEADILARMTAKRNLPNMVCFSYRFKAAARYMKHILEKGYLGQIYHVYMQYLQAGGGPEWDLPRSWRYIKELTGTGALGDLGCHALDLVRFVLGKEYTRVVGHTGTYVTQRKLPDGSGTGKVDVDDFCNYMADMEDGVSASFQITRFAFGRGNYQRMEIYGSEGAIVYSLDATQGVDDEIEVCSGDINAEAHAYTKLHIPEYYYSDQMQSFADIINGVEAGQAARIQDGKANQYVVDAILASAESGKWVEL